MTQVLERHIGSGTADIEGGRMDVPSAADGLRRRRVPIAAICLVAIATMAYTIWWGPVVLHHSYWITPGDIWGTLRTAQYVSWGDIGDVYNGGTALVTFPGIAVVLAPVALLADALHLSMGFPYGLTHPTAWLILGPVQAVLGSLVLLPLDAIAERLGVGRRMRLVTALLGAAALFPVLAIWGHPEDPLALALALWGLLLGLQNKWVGAGWLFGLAIVMQPLVVLVVPVVFACAPMRRWPMAALRCVLPSAVLLAIPLAQAWKATTTALFKQPNYPTIDHATPWLSLAPVLSKTHPERIKHFGQAHGRFTTSIVRTVAGETVASGPGRLLAIVIVCLIGVYVYRRRPGAEQVIWLCCVAMSLRCFFEPVMNPYYLWPPLALALVLAARSHRRLLAVALAGAAMTWWSYRHVGPWEWWAPTMLLLGIIVAAAHARGRSEPIEFAVATTAAPVQSDGEGSSRPTLTVSG